MYIYKSEVYCDDCAYEMTFNFPPPEGEYDSDEYPKEGLPGEVDTPLRCGSCGKFLDAPLTEYGEAYVLNAVNNALEKCEYDCVAYQVWRVAYSYLDFEDWGPCEICGCRDILNCGRCVSCEDIRQELLLSDRRGIYIPFDFVKNYDAELWHIDEEEAKYILDYGPGSELYWECWNEILATAYFIDKEGVKWHLCQDGDLWAVNG